MGRAETDPSLNWYQGEIGFFDFYIIPLAKKLKECGVFGVSSEEYLNYAVRNRQEWQSRGEEIVSEMIERICREYETNDNQCTNEQTTDNQCMKEQTTGNQCMKEHATDRRKVCKRLSF
jgi:hypothetical protein